MTMNSKLVLAILGSPHRNGTTASMMDIAIHNMDYPNRVTDVLLLKSGIRSRGIKCVIPN